MVVSATYTLRIPEDGFRVGEWINEVMIHTKIVTKLMTNYLEKAANL